MRHGSTWIFAWGLLGAGALLGCGNELSPELDGETGLGLGRDGKKPAPDRDCGGLLGLSCAKGELCVYEESDLCGAADATGVCRPRPEACTEQYDPVCGCDGTTYGNECLAHQAGISVSAVGECDEPPVEEPGCGGGDGGAPAPQTCGGIAGLACAEGEFCNLAVDAGGLGCDIADATGVCQALPDFCTREYAPVCGCDGKTYGNACTAHAHGVSVASEGECARSEPSPGDGTKVSCDPRALRCRRGPPKCAEGTVPSIVGTCYGDCVPVEQCSCSEAEACPQPDFYTCHVSAGHCGPFVR